MNIKILEKYIGKKVCLYISNNFRYSGVINSIELDTINFYDNKVGQIYICSEDIISIQNISGVTQ